MCISISGLNLRKTVSDPLAEAMTGSLLKLTSHTNTVAFSGESDDVTSDMVRLGVVEPVALLPNLPGITAPTPEAVELHLHW